MTADNASTQDPSGSPVENHVENHVENEVERPAQEDEAAHLRMVGGVQRHPDGHA